MMVVEDEEVEVVVVVAVAVVVAVISKAVGMVLVAQQRMQRHKDLVSSASTMYG